MKLGCCATLRLHSDLGSHRFRHGRYVRQTIGQRAKIEPRAADKNDRVLANFDKDVARRPSPSSDGKIDRAVDRAEQAVRRKLFLIGRRPCGQYPQVLVDLHRVGVDDRRAESLCERERRRRLAARRRACDEERPSHLFRPISRRRHVVRPRRHARRRSVEGAAKRSNTRSGRASPQRRRAPALARRRRRRRSYLHWGLEVEARRARGVAIGRIHRRHRPAACPSPKASARRGHGLNADRPGMR